MSSRLNHIHARRWSIAERDKRRAACENQERRRLKSNVFRFFQASLTSAAVLVGYAWLEKQRSAPPVETNLVRTEELPTVSLTRHIPNAEWRAVGFWRELESEPRLLPPRGLPSVDEALAADVVGSEVEIGAEEFVVAAPPADEIVEEDLASEAFLRVGSVPRELFLKDREAFSPRSCQSAGYDEDAGKSGLMNPPVAVGRFTSI